MPESKQQKIERLQVDLRFEFASLKSALLPFRENYEAAALNQWTRFVNSPPGGVDGLLSNIEQIIEDHAITVWSSGSAVQVNDLTGEAGDGKSVSIWYNTARGFMKRFADLTTQHMGTTYTIDDVIINDGNNVQRSYRVKPPVFNAADLANQKAMSDDLGAIYPPTRIAQLTQLSNETQTMKNQVITYENAINTAPQNAAIFQSKIDVLLPGIAAREAWTIFVTTGIWPGADDDSQILSGDTAAQDDVAVQPVHTPADAVILQAEEAANIVLQNPGTIAELDRAREELTYAENDTVEVAGANAGNVLQSYPPDDVPVEDLVQASDITALGSPETDLSSPVGEVNINVKTVPQSFLGVGAFGEITGDDVDGMTLAVGNFAGDVLSIADDQLSNEAAASGENSAKSDALKMAAVVAAAILIFK